MDGETLHGYSVHNRVVLEHHLMVSVDANITLTLIDCVLAIGSEGFLLGVVFYVRLQ